MTEGVPSNGSRRRLDAKTQQQDARDRAWLEHVATRHKDMDRCLNQLFLTYRGMILAIARRGGLSVADAEDLSQVVLIKIWKRADSYRGECMVRSWLRMIATNELIDMLRRAKRAPETHVEDEFFSTVAAQTPSAEFVLDRDAWDKCLRREWLRFARDYPERSEAIQCRIYDEASMTEVASLLQRTVHATTEFVSQSKMKLEEYFRRCAKFAEGML